MFPYSEHWPRFYTATILEWRPVLIHEACKNIIVQSLQFLVKERRVILYGFVIMSNHIHLIWQAGAGHHPSGVQLSFMKYTAQQMKFYLQDHQPEVLAGLLVNAADRKYQLWERNPLSVELYTAKVGLQKLQYLHQNPVKAGLCRYPTDYHYSSARFYETGQHHFNMLTNYFTGERGME